MTRHALAAAAALTGLFVITPAHAGGVLFEHVPGSLAAACGGGGCWSNHMRVTDIDGDDDLDVVVANYADFFGGGSNPEPLVVYANDGTATFTNVSAAAVGGFEGNVRQIAVGDVDDDGDLDIFVPDGTGAAYSLFINDGSGVFSDEADARMPASDYPRGAAARMGDFDNDGDLDILSGDGYAQGGAAANFGRLYLNDGTGGFVEAMGVIPGTLSGVDIDDLDVLDVDGDFDLDVFANAHNGGTGNLWINDGTGTFTSAGLPPPGNSGNHYNPGVCDVDGDGDLDIWIDNIGGGYDEQLLINDGTGTFTDETAARVTGNNGGSDDNGIICADIDDDGDFDAVVVALFVNERYLQNDGTGHFTHVAGAFGGPANCSLWGEMGDLDGDARFDLVTAEGECGATTEEVYIANAGVPEDSQAPQFRGIEDLIAVPPGQEAVVRFAVGDRSVTDEGPRLARAYAVLDPAGAATELDARFMGGDLFRAVLPAADVGPVTFRVCAEDRNANVACSEDQVYEIGDPPPGTTGDPDDTGDPDTSGGNPTSGGPDTSGNSNSGSATITVGGSGGETETETAAADDDNGGGCGCRQGTGPSPRGWIALGLLGLVGLHRRRRR